MARKCAACGQFKSIVDSGIAIGTAFSELAERVGVSTAVIARHARKHYVAAADDSAYEKQLHVWMARIDQLYHACGSQLDMRGQLESARSAVSLLEKLRELRQERESQGPKEPIWLDPEQRTQLNAKARMVDVTIQDFDRILELNVDMPDHWTDKNARFI